MEESAWANADENYHETQYEDELMQDQSMFDQQYDENDQEYYEQEEQSDDDETVMRNQTVQLRRVKQQNLKHASTMLDDVQDKPKIQKQAHKGQAPSSLARGNENASNFASRTPVPPENAGMMYTNHQQRSMSSMDMYSESNSQMNLTLAKSPQPSTRYQTLHNISIEIPWISHKLQYFKNKYSRTFIDKPRQREIAGLILQEIAAKLEEPLTNDEIWEFSQLVDRYSKSHLEWEDFETLVYQWENRKIIDQYLHSLTSVFRSFGNNAKCGIITHQIAEQHRAFEKSKPAVLKTQQQQESIQKIFYAFATSQKTIGMGPTFDDISNNCTSWTSGIWQKFLIDFGIVSEYAIVKSKAISIFKRAVGYKKIMSYEEMQLALRDIAAELYGPRLQYLKSNIVQLPIDKKMSVLFQFASAKEKRQGVSPKNYFKQPPKPRPEQQRNRMSLTKIQEQITSWNAKRRKVTQSLSISDTPQPRTIAKTRNRKNSQSMKPNPRANYLTFRAVDKMSNSKVLDEFELRDLFTSEDEEIPQQGVYQQIELRGKGRSPTPFRSKTKYDHVLTMHDKRLAQGNIVAQRIRRKLK